MFDKSVCELENVEKRGKVKFEILDIYACKYSKIELNFIFMNILAIMSLSCPNLVQTTFDFGK